MTKRILSVCLALAVLLVALPVLPAMGTASAETTVAEKYDNGKYFRILNTYSVNSFPAEAGNYPNAVDTGASVNPEYYGGGNTYVGYEYDAEKGAGKFSYISSGEGSAYTRPKILPKSNVNMVSFHLDATNVAGDSNGYFAALIELGYYWNTHTVASNTKMYFVEDGSDEIQEITVSYATSAWSQKSYLLAGKSGTYYIPAASFGPTTVEENGYANPWESSSWQNLWDDSLVNGHTWWMNQGNVGSSSFSLTKMSLSEGDYFYIDDLCYHEVETYHEGSNKDFTIVDELDINRFPAGVGGYTVSSTDTGAATNPEYYGRAGGSGGFTYSWDSEKEAGKYTYAAAASGTATAFVKVLPTGNINMLSFHMDATNVTATNNLLYASISLQYRQGAHYVAGGTKVYFLADGTDEVEVINVTTASSNGNQRVELRAGVSGTYFIPFSSFEPTTAAVSGYDAEYAIVPGTNTWTTLSDLVTNGQTWWMDGSNYTYTTFSLNAVTIGENEYFYLDDVRYLEVDWTEKELESNKYFTVKSEKVTNSFPRLSKQLNANIGYDPGAVARPETYGLASGNMAFEYDYANGIGKYIYSNSGSTAANTANLLIKNFSVDGVNMISAYIDLTNVAGSNGIFSTRLSMGMRNKTRYNVGGQFFYFLPDATADNPNPEIEKIYIPTSSSINSVRVPLQAGRAGTYFFPEKVFGEHIEAECGYSDGSGWGTTEWLYFDDDVMTNTDGADNTGGNAWWFDTNNANYTQQNLSLSYFSLNEGEYFYADDLKWVTAVNNYTVTYVDGEDAVMGTEIVEENAAPANVPTAPVKHGYTFTGWSVDVTQPVTADIVVEALYEKDSSLTYNVTTSEGTSMEIAGEKEVANYEDRVTIEAPLTSGEQTFAYWTANGAIFSYYAKLSFLTFGDVELEAVYTTEVVEDTVVVYNNPVATVTLDSTTGKYSMMINGVVSAEDATAVTEIGILLAASEMTAADMLTAYEDTTVTNDVYKLQATKATVDRQFNYTVKGIASGATRCAVVYAVVNGDMVVCENVCSATMPTAE